MEEHTARMLIEAVWSFWSASHEDADAADFRRTALAVLEKLEPPPPEWLSVPDVMLKVLTSSPNVLASTLQALADHLGVTTPDNATLSIANWISGLGLDPTMRRDAGRALIAVALWLRKVELEDDS